MKTTIIRVSLMMVALAASAAGAATITVDWQGSGDYATIQEGIDAAGGGDTVLVLPGTYTGVGNRDLNFGGTNLVLESQGGYAATIIDCGDAARGFIFHSCEDTTSVVSGFTVTKAAADSGAGAMCENGSTPRFEYCRFLDNTANELGGGLCCVGSSPIVRDCYFDENTAYRETPVSGYGGGVACISSSSPVIVDTDFTSNESYYRGGGLHCDYSAASIQGCSFVGNNLIGYGTGGAGAALAFSDGVTFTGCTFSGNGNASTVVGAGLFVSASAVTVTGCDFIDNTAGTSGGAQFTEGATGTVSGCTFAGNETTWGAAAGGINCVLGANPTITGCTFADNFGYHVYCQGTSPTIEYSILAFASATGPVGCQEGTETPHIHHCIVFGNAGTDTVCGGNFSDILNTDPLLCDRLNDDFTLCENSPCLAGATWPSLVGAHGQGCGHCDYAVEPTTWGSIKAIYR